MNTPERVRVSVRDSGAGLASGDAAAAVSAVQSPGTRAEHGRRHGHRPGDEQAAGGNDGRHHWRRKHGRLGKRVLVRTEFGSEPQLEADSTPLAALHVSRRARAAMPLRTLLYVEDNPANLKLIEQLIARRPDIRLLSATGRQSRHPAGARQPAGRHPHGHQSSGHQRHRSSEDPSRRSG